MSCGDPAAPCLMRHSQRLYEQSGITADLEVMARGPFLVPVVTLRAPRAE
ncbi:MAG TPA: hypothetical protein VE690_20170 [Rhodopila sp.]|nr:hypothetical protein [Rhodopila sp.]